MTGGTLTRLGVVLVVAGALLMAGPVFGFSSMAADRGVHVETTEDPGALLGFETYDDAEPNEDGIIVANITNNFGSEIDTLDVEVQPGILSVADGFDTQLNDGESTTLAVECGDATGQVEETIEITVSEALSTSAGLTVSRQTATVDVDYDCGGRDTDGDFIVSDVRTTGDTIEFDIENQGSEIDIMGLSLDKTTTSANEVDNDNEPEITFAEAEIDVPGSVAIDGERNDFHGGDRPTIETDEVVTVTIKSFLQDGSPVDMEGEELWFTIYEQQGGGTPVQQLAVSDEN